MNAALPSHSRFVVIGGGIVGCSTAYHLARDHHAEVLLLEQGRLSGGSTWHAAGLVGQLRSSASITQLLQYSVELYRRLKDETGLDTGWKMTGCLRLACNQDRWIEYQRLATTAASFGMEMALLSPSEVKTMWPLLNVGDLVGASYLPSDGQASPSDITQSLARGARLHGATLLEEVRVTGLRKDPGGGRIVAVDTDRGTVGCETVINCGGQWARQIGALAGVNVPLQPVKHQYVITEPIAGLDPDSATIRDPDRLTYFKEEVGGLALGGYEPNPIAWTQGDVPNDFQFRLFDDDWDHFEPHLRQAIERVPALAETGIKQMINGPESFTPDGNFILGRAPGVDNFYVGAGFNAFGIASAGGAGWALAQWAVESEAPLDLWSVDIRRFSALHRDRDWVCARTLEAYGKHYAIGYPHQHYRSGRPRLTSPLYRRLQRHRAVFGEKLGWERPDWFAPAGVAAAERPSMGRGNDFDAVGGEHRLVRGGVGLFDQSSFAKYELRGKDAAPALEWLCANYIGKPAGRLTYTQLLNSRGGIECDLTVARLAEDHFYLVTGTGFRCHDYEWIREHAPPGLDFSLRDVTEDYATLALMGPQARAVLQTAGVGGVANDAFPFGHVRTLSVAGRALRALRVSYVGELGWELHLPNDAAGEVFDALLEAGERYGLRPVGYRAIESLRLEKGYLAWGADITPNDSPWEAGLGWAVKLNRDIDVHGRAAAERAAAAPLKKKLARFTVDDPDVVLLGRETILRDGAFAGYLCSGGFGHTIGKPIGFGYVRAATAGGPAGVDDAYLRAGRYQLVVATRAVPATLQPRPLYDPSGARLQT